MANPTDPVLNGKHDLASTRIAELEAEVHRQRAELAESRRLQELDRECLVAHIMQDFPKSEAEFLRLVRTGPSLKQVLRELMPEAYEARDHDSNPLSS